MALHVLSCVVVNVFIAVVNGAVTSPYAFGGIYQTCVFEGGDGGDICPVLEQVNVLTGGDSCPRGYDSTTLLNNVDHVISVNHTYQDPNDCYTASVGWYWARKIVRRCRWKCCRVRTSRAVLSLMWCKRKDNTVARKQLLFGGLFNHETPNPMTGQRSCPKYFKAKRFGTTGSICVSKSINKRHLALPFGGFRSCLSSDWPCPDRFNKSVNFVEEDGCMLSYCLSN